MPCPFNKCEVQICDCSDLDKGKFICKYFVNGGAQRNRKSFSISTKSNRVQFRREPVRMFWPIY